MRNGQAEDRQPKPLASLERYIENAPALAQKAIGCWNDISNRGLRDKMLYRVPKEFLALVDRALRYEAATRHLESREHFETASEEAKHEVEQARLVFAQEYKRLDDLTGGADELLTTQVELNIEDLGK